MFRFDSRCHDLILPKLPGLVLQVWEAAIVEVLERALPLANVREGIRNRQGLHANILASAERAATVLGLRRTDLVDL